MPEERVGGSPEMPAFLVVASAPEDAWLQADGRPGLATFVVYEVEGVEVEPPGRLLFWRIGSASNGDPTADLADAEPAATGTVKWDGCVHLGLGYDHACDAAELASFAAALQRGYELAADLTVAADMR